MGQGVAHRAMHLRHAAQRVGVLHPVAIAMRLAQRAAFEHLAQIRGRPKLTRVRTSLMDAFVERHVRASQGVERERADHVRRIGQDFSRQQRQDSHRQHRLRAVDQGDGLLGLKHQRLDLSAPHGVGGGNALALFVQALALADQRQRQVRQRSQIATGSNAALRRHHRGHAAIQHLANRVDDRRATPEWPLEK